MRAICAAVLLTAVIFAVARGSNTCTCDSGEFDEARMTRKELGNHGWALMHTMAAYFPKDAKPELVDHAHLFLKYFGELFPCRECGGHFLEMLKDTPPVFATKEEFMIYMCELHNRVNERLGYSVFDCSIPTLIDRWGGDAECACSDSFLEAPKA